MFQLDPAFGNDRIYHGDVGQRIGKYQQHYSNAAKKGEQAEKGKEAAGNAHHSQTAKGDGGGEKQQK